MTTFEALFMQNAKGIIAKKSYENRLKTDVLRRFLVRVGRLELPASCSQSKRATNCATPGYEVFQLWSNMGSAPVFDQFPAGGKTPSALVSQNFPGFQESAARTPASRSQSRRATNCATPRLKNNIYFSVFLSQ